jgi:AcrR family transcriptional regulator
VGLGVSLSGATGQRRKREETRTRIVESAARTFARRGYHGASLDEIARGAGYTKGALYYNFKSKEDLFLALLDEHIEERLNLLAAIEAQTDPPEARLRAGAGRVVSSLESDRDWSLLFFEFAAYAAREPRFRRKFAARLRPVRAAMGETIRALSAGSELALPPERIALGVNALVDGIAMNRLIDPAAAPDTLLGEILAVLWRGLAVER